MAQASKSSSTPTSTTYSRKRKRKQDETMADHSHTTSTTLPASLSHLGSIVTPPSSSNPASLDDALADLDKSTHADRLASKEKIRANKGTETAYGRHVKKYHEFWAKENAKRVAKTPPLVAIPSLPITAAKAAEFIKFEAGRNKQSRHGEILGTSVSKSHIKQVINALEDERFNHHHEEAYKKCPASLITLRKDNRIKQFEDAAGAKEPQRVADAHTLKAKGSMADSYTQEELIRMSRSCLEGYKDKQVHYGIRDRAMLLVSTSIAFRGDNTRMLEWSDLFLHNVPMPDISEEAMVPALVFMSNQGKTNTAGRIDEHGAFRHRSPELCGIGSVALLFFSWFHISGREVPNFAPDFTLENGEYGKRPWYQLLVFPGSKSDTDEMSYTNHHDRIQELHRRNNVSVSKITHAGRVYSAMTAREHSASEYDTKVMGGWSRNSSITCYDRTLPSRAMLAAATFNANHQDSYILPRGDLEPPPNLLQSIFPWIEKELEAYEQRVKRYGQRATDMALKSFLAVLKFFRVVLLQDAAILFQKYPHSAVFKFAPFNTPGFIEFSNSSTQILADAKRRAIQEAEIAPKNTRALAQQHQSQTANELSNIRSLLELLRRLEAPAGPSPLSLGPFPTATTLGPHLASSTLGPLLGSSTLGHFPTSSSTFTPSIPLLNTGLGVLATGLPLAAQPPALPNALTSGCVELFTPPQKDLLKFAEIDSPIDQSAWSQLQSSLVLSTDLDERRKQVDALQGVIHKFGVERLAKHKFEWVYRTGSLQDEWLPFYAFKKNPTVEEVWTEYSTGVDGCLSVRDLEEGWAARWRRNKSAIKTEMGRRKKLIDLINQLADKPKWNSKLALRFLQDKYPIPSKSTPHLRTTRAFMEYLQNTELGACKQIISASADYHFPRAS